MAESFDHRPPGRIRQSRKGRTQSIHNRMVVDCPSMSSANTAIQIIRSLIFDYCDQEHLPSTKISRNKAH